MSQMLNSYQVMPIHNDTFVGVPTSEAIKRYSLVLANSDGDITFIYSTGNVVVPAVAGQAFVVNHNCTGVTSLISVTMS